MGFAPWWNSIKRRAGLVGQRRERRQGRARLHLEPLEARALLTAPPAWVFQGPSPITKDLSSHLLNPSTTGAIASVAVNPDNPSQMYIASVNGGIWRTDNASLTDPTSVTWRPLTDQQPSLATSNLAFSPLDPTRQTLFAATGARSSFTLSVPGFSGPSGLQVGVMKTTDGGANWTVTRLNPRSAEPVGIKVLPTTIKSMRGQLIVVGARGVTGGGVYYSMDGGDTYTRELTAPWGSDGVAVTQLVADPNAPGVFYVGITGKGIFRGVWSDRDQSVTWKVFNNGLGNTDFNQNIQITAQNYEGTTWLFAFLSNLSWPRKEPGISRMNTATGTTWSTPKKGPDLFNNQGGGGNTVAIVADPQSPDDVYVGGVGSPDGLDRYDFPAGKWKRLDSNSLNPPERVGPNKTYVHTDFRDLVFVNNITLLAASDGGLFFLQKPLAQVTADWQTLNGNTPGKALGITEVLHVAYDSNSQVLVGGSFDNGVEYQENKGSLAWANATWGDGGYVQVDTATLAANHLSLRYSSATDLIDFRRQTYDANGKLDSDLVLFPGNAFSTFLKGPSFAPSFLTPTALDAIAPTAGQLDNESTRLVIGGRSGVLYESANVGRATTAEAVTWKPVSTAPGLGDIVALAYGGRLNGVDNPDLLYAADSSHVYVRLKPGGTLSPTATAFPGTDIVGIALNPADERDLFVASATNVYETPDAGTTWIKRTGNLGTFVFTVQSITDVLVGSINVVVVGAGSRVNRYGVFEMTSATPGDWAAVGTGLPNTLTYDLQYSAGADLLIAAQLGRGVWTLPNASRALIESETQIAIISGAAGTGTLDHLLSATKGTITPADDPGDLPATLSTGALLSVGAGVPISITADNSIVFNDIGTLTLPNGAGVDAAFKTLNGTISFVNAASTVSTTGGSLTFSAGAELTTANLSAPVVTLSSATGDVDLAGALTVTGTVTITSPEGAIRDADAGETEPADPVSDLANGTPADITTPTLRMTAGTGIGVLADGSAGPLETQVSNLEAVATTGGIFVTNGVTAPIALTIVGGGSSMLDGVIVSGGGPDGDGDVQLVNNGSINIVNANAVIQNSVGGSVLVQAVGAAADVQTGGQAQFDAIRADGGGSVQVTAGRDVVMGNSDGPGNIVSSLVGLTTITAGRDLIVDAGSLLDSDSDNGSVTVEAGRNITVQATAGKSGASVHSDGDVSLTTGLGGTLTLGSGTYGEIASEGGSVGLNADTLVIQDPIHAAAGLVTLAQAGTATRNIDVGRGTTAGSLGISDATLDRITAAIVEIGRPDNPGSLTITAPVTAHAGFATLGLDVGGLVVENGGVSVQVDSLAVRAAGPVMLNSAANHVATLAAAVTGNGNALVFNDADPLTIGSANGLAGIAVNGGTVDLVVTASLNVLLPIDVGKAIVRLTAQGTIDLAAAFTADQVNVHGSGGSDTFLVTPASLTPINLDGLGGTNTLRFQADGLRAASVPGALLAYLSSTATERVSYFNIGTLAISSLTTNGYLAPDTADRNNALAGLTANERFIQLLYLDVLGRAGSKTEVDAWLPYFNNATQAQAQTKLTATFNGSAEGRKHLVNTWYVGFLGRQGPTDDDSFWVNLLMMQTEEQVLSQVLASTEFFTRAQGLFSTGTANERYVRALYQFLFQRPADAAGLSSWVPAVAAQGRQAVALDFLKSAEFRTNLFDAYYVVLLRRPSDSASLAAWVASQETTLSLRLKFEASPEFFVDG